MAVKVFNFRQAAAGTDSLIVVGRKTNDAPADEILLIDEQPFTITAIQKISPGPPGPVEFDGPDYPFTARLEGTTVDTRDQCFATFAIKAPGLKTDATLRNRIYMIEWKSASLLNVNGPHLKISP